MYDYDEKLKSKRKNEDDNVDQIALAMALGFDEDDLAENETGRLSDQQRTSLQYRRSRGVLTGLIIFMGCALVFMIFTNLKINTAYSGGTATMLIVAVVGVAWGGSTLNTAWQQHLDLTGDTVHSREGYIMLDIRQERSGKTTKTIYELMIGDQTFRIDQQTLLAFKNEEPYIVYYLPNTRRIVSARWLRDAADLA